MTRSIGTLMLLAGVASLGVFAWHAIPWGIPMILMTASFCVVAEWARCLETLAVVILFALLLLLGCGLSWFGWKLLAPGSSNQQKRPA